MEIIEGSADRVGEGLGGDASHDREHLGVTKRSQQERKPVRIGDGVVVEECQDVTGCSVDSGVACLTDPALGFGDNPCVVALSLGSRRAGWRQSVSSEAGRPRYLAACNSDTLSCYFRVPTVSCKWLVFSVLTALAAEKALFRTFVFKMLTALGICSKSGRNVATEFGGF